MHRDHDETTTELVDSDLESDNEENKSNTEDNNSEMEENVFKSDTKTCLKKIRFEKHAIITVHKIVILKSTLRTYIQTAIKRGSFQTLMLNDRTKP